MKGLLTTTVGSFAKPDYLQKARTKFAAGKATEEELRGLERQATKEVVEMQEALGLDVFVHGEMERGDMVAYFAENFPGMAPGDLVRAYGNRYYHKPIIAGELGWDGPVTVDMWKFTQGLTRKPVKGMLTGPYTMVEWSFDDHYGSRKEATLGMAKVLHKEAQALAKAGAKYIQVDEPAIHTRPGEDFDLAVEAMGVVVKGVSAEFHTHICYGDVPKIYPGMLRLPVTQIHLAFKNANFELLHLLEADPWDSKKELGLGVLDVHDHHVESVEEVKEGIKHALRLVPADRLWIEPDCGLKTRTPEEVRKKLRVMVAARDEVRRDLAL
ncbi:MAG: methionine synthase [Armatimonadetes bacterium 13_1_40CM_3_65_7]|nr:MAG: methionine synthase [Armatimonadetes bacterium 13_1_40CM_3_65_7]